MLRLTALVLLVIALTTACGSKNEPAPLYPAFNGIWTGTTHVAFQGSQTVSYESRLAVTTSGHEMTVSQVCSDGTGILLASGSNGSATWNGTVVCGGFASTDCTNLTATYASGVALLNGDVLTAQGTGTGDGCGTTRPITLSFSGTKQAVNGNAPISLTYSNNPAVYTVGTPITPNVPSSAGGSITSYAVSPGLPPSLSLNTSTGVITGTPSATSVRATYTITGSNAVGSTAVILSITVGAGSGVTPPSGLAGTFVATGSLVNSRYAHTATLLPNGKVLVAGGFDAGGATSSAELYDPATGSFTGPVSMSMFRSRGNHTSTLLLSGKVLLTGGDTRAGGFADPAELYDPTTGRFTATGAMGTSREGHTATLLTNGKVLIVGGQRVDEPGAQIYEPITGTFSSAGAPLVSRAGGHTATLLPTGKVLITGGVDGSGGLSTYLASAELYDPSTNTFAMTGFMNTARANHTATLLPNGKALIAGGQSAASGIFKSAEIYDPTTGSFTSTGPMTSVRTYHSAALIPGGKVLVTGGNDGTGVNGGYLSTADLYDPTSDVFTPAGAMRVGRTFHTSTLLPGGNVLVSGGAGLNGRLGSAEIWGTTP